MRSNKVIQNFDNIKQYVLTLGEFEESDKLDLWIECYINEILAYLNRDCVCECMELPVAEAIVNELNKYEFANSSVGFEGNITSYKEGDMSINFGGDATSNGTVMRYGGKLEGFKLITGLKRCSG